jgi:hypothetical protein
VYGKSGKIKGPRINLPDLLHPNRLDKKQEGLKLNRVGEKLQPTR